jgi:hypothetical protein
MIGHFFAISSDGQMTGQEMMRELREHRIAPILVLEIDGVTVPMFSTKIIAQKFAKRNTHRDYIIGTLEASAEDMKKIEEAGWKVQIFNFPVKRDTSVRVLEISREVETHRREHRRHI